MSDDGESSGNAGGVSRRGFMQSVGVGLVGAAAAGGVEAAEIKTSGELAAGDLVEVALMVNGRRRRGLVEPRTTLVHVLREVFGLTATKVGCDRGECGACTVLIDQRPRYACMTLAVEAEGHEVTTLEGLMKGEELGTVQQAFAAEDGFQCGFCTPGQIVAAEGLLQRDPSPDMDAIRTGVSGNLCRCGAYRNIFAAVRRAAELRKGEG